MNTTSRSGRSLALPLLVLAGIGATAFVWTRATSPSEAVSLPDATATPASSEAAPDELIATSSETNRVDGVQASGTPANTGAGDPDAPPEEPSSAKRIDPPPPESAVVRSISMSEIPPEAWARLESRRRAAREEGEKMRKAGKLPSDVGPIDVERTGLVRPMGEDRLIQDASGEVIPLSARDRLQGFDDSGN